ncbi:THO complex subunit 5 homolog [Piliocolobus tephrosceles]|uniref:THO complex subunit 5 homolog n=1 Tax=Piliocolobus tephrosceles TaxID=591936 RepID=UPI000E6B19EB|nr:THO complex subunit 5 homolog [Piliocolobus tephrosceles]
MSSESSKKRKPKVIRSDGAPAEGKRNRSDTEQEGKYYSEEAEVDLRDPGRDYELYKYTCQELQRLMAEIQDLKSRGGKDVAIEIEERRIQSCVHFMTLKKLNRLAHIRLKKGRDQTHEAKQKVDAYHLQLQNLLYEVMHLQKEITKCLEFKSKHEEIDLVSLEEFYNEAPPDISKAEVTMGDPHQQTLARLDWELEQRKRLAEKYRECLSNKEKILKEIEVKKEYLSSLQPRLNSIMQALPDAMSPFEICQVYYPKLEYTYVEERCWLHSHCGLFSFSSDLLSPDSVLSCLYPGDHGKKTPNPANQYQFDKVGILTLSDYVLELGHPYLWVQKLGGLHFPKEQPQQTVIADHSLSASHMETTMKLLKTRVQSRLALHKQFASLEHGIVPVTSDCQYLFPAKVVSRLVKWVTIAHEDYMELHFTKDIVDAGLAGDTNLYYMALIERGTAKLQAAVVLNPGYSSIPPVFQLCLNWKGEKTNSNDDNIRAMEGEVNVCYKELCGPWPSHQLLTNQLQRLCVLLDVYLETESHDDSVEGPKEFPQEKMCLRLFRGPSRMKPFKYNHPQGFFSHR